MDMVTMNIIDSTMVSVCREMGIVLMKTSYSTIFNEALDFTCALAGPDGEMISQAEFCPSMIGGVPLLARSCVREFKPGEIEEGDVIVHNDPYRGGLHCPEHTMIKPVYVDGEIMAYAMSIGHLVEIGGMVAGAFAGEATEIFQEGIRVPPVKIRAKGEDVEEVWKLLLANVRTPRYNYGDLRALIAAVDLGEKRLVDLIRKYGKETFRKTIADLITYSEARMRAEIAQIPDGQYKFSDTVEDDGIEAKPYTINVTVHVQGDEAVIDYTGTSKQARGPINGTLGVSWSAAYNAMLHMTDQSIPRNSGCFKPIRVVSPPGTVVNVDYPGPEVGGNTETHCKIAGTIIGAMAKAVPNRTMAAEGATHTNFVFSGYDKAQDETFVCYAIELGGWGGRSFADGNDATDAINGNCRVVPVEVFETRYPWQTMSYELVQDSGGPGEHRGGLSTRRTLKNAKVEITGSQMSDRHRNQPWGLNGGQKGGLAGTWYRKANSDRWQMIDEAFGKVSASKWANIRIQPGDSMRFQTPGGGGWGDPKKRPRDQVQEDLREGYISKDVARKVYGLEAGGGD
ncbi:MAG: hydantoinase B/oxoprolinase family protein [Alphaproteobacteria bacterium]|nr:hydantoinase B/oxoprolinase family protein [Alphaproteobacteria bacterium]